MDNPPLQIQMLGGLSIRRDSRLLQISGRSRKLCLLLAYLICERSRPVPLEELMDLFWEDEDRGPNPLNALKAILHRTRTCLEQLGEGAGRALILNQDGCCQWNRTSSLSLDAEEFLRLCQSAGRAQPEDRQLALRLEALSLYRGDFLPMLSGCSWASAKAEELHQLYLQTVLEALPMLDARERWEEQARLAGHALSLDPRREDLCRWQMEALLRLDRRQETAQVYEELQERLLSQLGVMPSDRLREIYREARSSADPRAISPVTLLERLQEPPQIGPLLCDFDFFRVVCHAAARRAGRSGESLHLALISLAGQEGRPLARHSLDRAMDHLEGILLARLRRGDAAARCSASQFALLLPQAGYQNSKMVCTRIQKAFTRQFPHSPAALEISVQPLTPHP